MPQRDFMMRSSALVNARCGFQSLVWFYLNGTTGPLIDATIDIMMQILQAFFSWTEEVLLCVSSVSDKLWFSLDTKTTGGGDDGKEGGEEELRMQRRR